MAAMTGRIPQKSPSPCEASLGYAMLSSLSRMGADYCRSAAGELASAMASLICFMCFMVRLFW